jgi:hypothetical protein
MVCRPNDFVCVALEWIEKHGDGLPEIIQKVMEPVVGETGFVRTNLKEIIAAASFAFGVWRWWVYRESILHRRLVEYINESDARLPGTSAAAVEAILRPGRTVSVPRPSFAHELNRILVQMGWAGGVIDRMLGETRIEQRSRWRLLRERRRLLNRHAVAVRAEKSLQAQMAHIHLISGAIAAAKARRSRNKQGAARYDEAALREFRAVLQVPGFQRNIAAKENEAFHLLRLGEVDLARAAYRELEALAVDLPTARERDLLIARSRRYQGQIYQIEAGRAGRALARDILVSPLGNPNPESAEFLINQCQPLKQWDAIEQAELFFLAAVVFHLLNAAQREAEFMEKATRAYQDVLEEVPLRRSLLSRGNRLLRREAKRGLRLCARGAGSESAFKWVGI